MKRGIEPGIDLWIQGRPYSKGQSLLQLCGAGGFFVLSFSFGTLPWLKTVDNYLSSVRPLERFYKLRQFNLYPSLPISVGTVIKIP